MSWIFASFGDALLRRTDTLGIADLPFTLSVWFKRGTHQSTDQCLAALAVNGSGLNQYGAFIQNTGLLQAKTRNSTGQSYALSTVSVTDTTTWHHVCAVFAATNSRIVYVDGADKQSNGNTRTLNIAPNCFVVGALPDSTFDANTTKIGPVAVWNVALTDAEVATLAAGASAKAVRPANLMAFFRNNVNADPAPEDSGGVGLTHVEPDAPITFSLDDPPAAGQQATLLTPDPGQIVLPGGVPTIGTSGPPTFLVQPSVAGRSGVSYVVAFTTSAAATIYGIAQPRGLDQPSVTQIIAGRDATGAPALAYATKDVNGTDNLVLDLDGDPPFPVHDLYLLLTA